MKSPLSLQLAETAAPPGSTTALPAPHPTNPGATSPRRYAWLDRATHPKLLLAVCVASIGLLAWSLLVRLPLARQSIPRVVQPVSQTGTPGPSSARFETADVARLRAQSTAATEALVPNRAAFHQLLARIEADAQRAGLRLQITVAPPLRDVGGFTNLMAYPVAATLNFLDDTAPPAAPYTALEDWLAALVRLPQRTEITDLTLIGHGRGVASARVDFRILGLTDHGNVDPK